MAIYRSDQAVVTFGAEAALGGYIEGGAGATATATATSTIHTTAASAGDMSITVQAIGNFALQQFIYIGTKSSAANQKNTEVRKVVGVSGNVIYIDAPLGFDHAIGQEVKTITTKANSVGDKFNTFIPGVYDTVTTPDMTPTIEPRYYLGTGAKRNFTAAYKGTQSYNGSIPSFILLNGWPLRFPLGKINTTMNATASGSAVKTGATAGGSGGLGAKKGDVWLAVASGTDIDAGDYIQIGASATTYEVNRVVSKSTDLLQLATPLKADHAVGIAVVPMVSTGAATYFTHTITETNELDSISMDVHMRDSGETAANDFDRRFYGGKVGAATISAEEGGLLVMGWDTVPFMGGVHTQKLTDATRYATDMPFFTHFNPSSDKNQDDSDVNEIGSRSVSGAPTTIAYPTQDPYYFSEGSVSMFGQTFARVRNFSISINNNVEPRYYIERRGDSRVRGPSDIVEMRREYTMTATIALPDSTASLTGDSSSLFKELMFEGDYGTPQGTGAGMKGFAIQLVFNKGAVMTGVTGASIAGVDHKMTIDIPTDATAGGMDLDPATGLNTQGAYLTEAPHPIDGSNPLEVSASLIFRNMGITIVDNVGLYP